MNFDAIDACLRQEFAGSPKPRYRIEDARRMSGIDDVSTFESWNHWLDIDVTTLSRGEDIFCQLPGEDVLCYFPRYLQRLLEMVENEDIEDVDESMASFIKWLGENCRSGFLRRSLTGGQLKCVEEVITLAKGHREFDFFFDRGKRRALQKYPRLANDKPGKS